MKKRNRYILLTTIFMTYFLVRIYFSLSTPYFNSDSSYFALRQIDHIIETAKPLTEDALSYGGRTFLFMPLYYYLLAFFAKFFSKIVIIKIINNFFASSIIVSVYLVSKEIFKNRRISVITALVASTIPIYITETLNDISLYSIIVPGSFLLLYLFMNINDFRLILLILLTAVLILSSASSFLIIFGLIIYLMLSKLENLAIPKIELEFTVFFLVFFMWSSFVIFKPALQIHGFNAIWKNIPVSIISQFFTDIDLSVAITSIGLLPFIFGIYTVYTYLLKKKSKNIYLFIGLFLAAFILFWLRLIEAELALIFLSISLVIMFGQFLKNFFALLKNSKLSQYSKELYFLVIIVLLVTQLGPGFLSMNKIINKSPDSEYIDAFKWLDSNTNKSAVVLSILEEGNLITYFGKRKNVADGNYLLIEDVNVRIDEVNSIYTQKFKIEAIRIMEKYDIDYIIFSDKASSKYKIKEISYIDDECFVLVYGKGVNIYRRAKEICHLKNL